MDSKVALITGSSSGCGAETARLFAKKGYQVILHGSKQEKLDQIVLQCNKLSPNGKKALGLVADFQNPEEAKTLVQNVVAIFKRLDILVDCASIWEPSEIGDLDSLSKTMTVNCDSHVALTFEAVTHLKKTKGTIVYVASVDATIAYWKCYAFAMSKCALIMLARCMAIELGKFGVRVNIVSPGRVESSVFNQESISQRIDEDSTLIKVEDENLEVKNDYLEKCTLLGKLGRPEDVANAIEFLSDNEKSSFIHGQEIIVDGGCSYVGIVNAKRQDEVNSQDFE